MHRLGSFLIRDLRARFWDVEDLVYLVYLCFAQAAHLDWALDSDDFVVSFQIEELQESLPAR